MVVSAGTGSQPREIAPLLEERDLSHAVKPIRGLPFFPWGYEGAITTQRA